jgi:hypothetical protein
MEEKKITLTRKQVAFCLDIVDGYSEFEAYKRNYTNNKLTDIQVRFYAKELMEKEAIQAYIGQLVVDRKNNPKVDEQFVIENLKKIVIDKQGTTTAVRALELLGKYLAMFVDRQTVDVNSSQRETAEMLFERRMAMARGEDVPELEDVNNSDKIIKFEIKDGTDG